MHDYKTWAENIITQARQYGTAQYLIEKALQTAFEAGYRYAVKTDWWREQDAEGEPCAHVSDNQELSNPPQLKCSKCDDWFDGYHMHVF